jgi:hypothetical protein
MMSRTCASCASATGRCDAVLAFIAERAEARVALVSHGVFLHHLLLALDGRHDLPDRSQHAVCDDAAPVVVACFMVLVHAACTGVRPKPATADAAIGNGRRMLRNCEMRTFTFEFSAGGLRSPQDRGAGGAMRTLTRTGANRKQIAGTPGWHGTSRVSVDDPVWSLFD